MGVVPIRLIVQRYEEEAKATNFDCVFFIQQTIVSELSTRSEIFRFIVTLFILTLRYLFLSSLRGKDCKRPLPQFRL